MRNSNNQDSKTKETPSPKHQGAKVVYQLSTNRKISEGLLHDGDGASERKLHPFDLEERTARFGERIVRFVKRLPRGPQYPENFRLIDQLTGAGTSVGANYCEANDCVSRKDFKFTIKRCIKEAKETRFFLRMVVASEPSLSAEARELYREATELIRIFAAMHRK